MGPPQPTLPPSCIYPLTGLPAVPVHVLEPGAPPSRSPQAQGAGGGERCEQRMRAQFEALNGGSLSSHRRGSKLVGVGGQGQQGGWETVLSSRHLGWTSEPQLTPAEFSAPNQLLGQSAPGPRLVGAPERAEKGSSIVESRAVGHSGQENSRA